MARTKRNTPKTAELAAPKTETRIVMLEAGTSGLKENYGFVSEAYNTALQWPQCSALYSRLQRSTPEIVMSSRTFSAWASVVELQADLPDEPTDDDKRYQEFLYQVFDDMEGGQARFKDDMVRHTPFDGFYFASVVP